MTEQVGGPTARVDKRLNILDFARDGIGFSVPTVTSSPPIVVIGCEMRCEQVREVRTRPSQTGAQRPGNQDESRSMALPIIGDGCSVFGSDDMHGTSPFPGLWKRVHRVDRGWLLLSTTQNSHDRVLQRRHPM